MCLKIWGLCYNKPMPKKWTKDRMRDKNHVLAEKICTYCGFNKRISDFYYIKTRDRHTPRCKPCLRKLTSEKSRIERKIVGSNQWYRKRYDRLRGSALNTNRLFKLSFDEYKEIRKTECFYCGQTYQVMTIDRVDNDQGYNKYNCVSACHSCNRSKNSVTINICRKVVGFIDNR